VLNAVQKAGNHYPILKEASGVAKIGENRKLVKVLYLKFSGTGENKRTKNKYRQV
jgi:hypothetical protein